MDENYIYISKNSETDCHPLISTGSHPHLVGRQVSDKKIRKDSQEIPELNQTPKSAHTVFLSQECQDDGQYSISEKIHMGTSQCRGTAKRKLNQEASTAIQEDKKL